MKSKNTPGRKSRRCGRNVPGRRNGDKKMRWKIMIGSRINILIQTDVTSAIDTRIGILIEMLIEVDVMSAKVTKSGIDMKKGIDTTKGKGMTNEIGTIEGKENDGAVPMTEGRETGSESAIMSEVAIETGREGNGARNMIEIETGTESGIAGRTEIENVKDAIEDHDRGIASVIDAGVRRKWNLTF